MLRSVYQDDHVSFPWFNLPQVSSVHIHLPSILVLVSPYVFMKTLGTGNQVVETNQVVREEYKLQCLQKFS